MRPWRLAVQTFERFDREPVQPDSPGRREAVVERVADQHVREPQPAGTRRHVGHEPCGHRLVERLEQRVLRHLAHPRERRSRELASEHGRKLEHAVAFHGEVSEAPGDHVPDALGIAIVVSISPATPSRARSRTVLRDEERVSLRLLVQRRAISPVTRAPLRSARRTRNRIRAQARERQPARHRLARELRERLPERCDPGFGSTSRNAPITSSCLPAS
jgi:hypothetical protein